MITQVYSALDSQGFCIIENLISDSMLERMREAADESSEEVQVWLLDALAPDLGELLWAGPVAAAMLELLGPASVFLSAKAVNKGTVESRATPWHQDRPYWKGELPKYSLWIALDDAVPANGCLRVIPGSHTRRLEHGRGEGDRFTSQAMHGVDEGRAVDVVLRAGQAVLFHDLLLHASHPGQAGHPRRSLIVTYRAHPDEPGRDYWPGYRQLSS